MNYPLDAIREALVNALYHRGYQPDASEPTKVYCYPDRIDITSYPGPVPGIEPDHFLPGAAVPAMPARNRRIGEFLLGAEVGRTTPDRRAEDLRGDGAERIAAAPLRFRRGKNLVPRVVAGPSGGERDNVTRTDHSSGRQYMRSATCRRLRGAVLCAASTAVLVVPGPAEARVVRIEIERLESPTFEGRSFGDVGPYEKLVGRVFGEVDPEAPENAVITDIELAPRNARGLVEYAADLLVLRPVDPSKGNGRIFYELNNRGRMLSLGQLNDARSGGNDPTAAADAGNGFLMRRGYTFVSSGWDATAAPDGTRLRIAAPIAVNPDGSSVVGPALEEFVVDNDSTLTGGLTYPAASRDTGQASLTVRKRYADVPEPIGAGGWEYIDDRTIRLRPPGTRFEQGRLYELVYPARDPRVAGLGFAAVRDVVAFLRHAATDEAGAPNPLAGSVAEVLTMGISQAARFLRDFVHLGFNADENGRRVFDGVLNWIGGASGGFFNYRFAQPFRTHRQHIARWFPEREFPFANHLLTDPVTGRTDGRLERCRASGTCPRLMEANSANEYWVKGASLLHTDLEGNDLPDPPEARFYLFSSLPHAAGSGSSGLGICRQPRNPLVANAGLRALLVALDEWVATGAEPPASRVPRRADGSLTIPLPREMVGFPNIPGVEYTGLMSTGDRFDYGPASTRAS